MQLPQMAIGNSYCAQSPDDIAVEAVAIRQPLWGGTMYARSSGFLDPATLATLETAFDQGVGDAQRQRRQDQAGRTRAVHAPSSDGGRARSRVSP
jgi:hypothetical protein